jgi:phage gpG-like protein
MSNSAHEFAKIWSNKLARVQRLLRRLPRDVGNEALLFFLNLFKQEQSPEGKPWSPRKGNGDGARSSRRSLLVKSGRLRKSIRLTRVTSNSASIGTNVSYAKYHNEGTERLPQRQFIGKSAELTRRLQRMIKAKILWELRK